MNASATPRRQVAYPAITAILGASLILLVTIARQGDDAGQAFPLADPAPKQGMARDQPAQAPVLQSRTEEFTRDRSGFRISVAGMERTMAAERLAELTGSRVVSGAHLLGLSPPLDLHWQGSDPLEAWKRVLGDGLRHSINCERDGCVVRILSIAEVEGGTVLVPEPAPEAVSHGLEAETGLMNRPTDPDSIDESSLGQ